MNRAKIFHSDNRIPIIESRDEQNATPQQRKHYVMRFIIGTIFLVFSYYIGIVIGMNLSIWNVDFQTNRDIMFEGYHRDNKCNTSVVETNDKYGEEVRKERIEKAVDDFVQKAIARIKKEREDMKVLPNTTNAQHQPINSGNQHTTRRFDNLMDKFAGGMAKVDRSDFRKVFDYGTPDIHTPPSELQEVMILYSSKESLPTRTNIAHAAVYNSANESDAPLVSALEATENCDALNVIIASHAKNTNNCLAIVGGYESHHIQKWSRTLERKGINRKDPLRHVSRGLGTTGRNFFDIPGESSIQQHWKRLKVYLDSLQQVKDELIPLAKRVAKNNTIIIMVCNFGQSVLLMNFVCSARSKGFDLSNILLFATDIETVTLARKLGLEVFYDTWNFNEIPTKEAKNYGDRTFTSVMFAKVIPVQLINMLGYDILFQDVDVVWYKNPLLQFHNVSSSLAKFDILFQDDGARSLRYAPFSANSGFYYIRCNPKTNYAFTMLLRSGDAISSTMSHQQPLSYILTEHASLFGLKVKVLSPEEYPGGFHYNRVAFRDVMREIGIGSRIPTIFHMSWTRNKVNKVLFMKQMGMWYVFDECKDKGAEEILMSTDGKNHDKGGKNEISTKCCSAEPIVTCHYSDKPSVVDCAGSPKLDKSGKTFKL